MIFSYQEEFLHSNWAFLPKIWGVYDQLIKAKLGYRKFICFINRISTIFVASSLHSEIRLACYIVWCLWINGKIFCLIHILRKKEKMRNIECN